MTKNHPDRLTAAALAPLLAYAAQHRHGVTDIASRANRIGGTAFSRQHIYQYLTGDDAKRVEPRHGVGLLLELVMVGLLKEGVLFKTKKGWQVFA